MKHELTGCKLVKKILSFSFYKLNALFFHIKLRDQEGVAKCVTIGYLVGGGPKRYKITLRN